MADVFAARLAHEKLSTEAGISDFVKKTDFDNKQKNIINNNTSNKMKHAEAENKLTV